MSSIQTPGGLCSSWLFQSSLFLFHLSLSSFCVSFQTWYLPSHLVHAAVVCINPATAACYPAVSAWLGVHAELLSCWPHGIWWFLPSIRGLSFGGGCAAGRSALFNTCALLEVSIRIFPSSLRGVPVLSRKGGWEQVSLLHSDLQEHSSAVSLLACPSSPSSWPGYRGLSVQPGVKPGGSVSLPSQALLCYVHPNAWLAYSSGLMLTLYCALAPTDSRSGGFQWSSVCRAPMRTLLFAVKGRQCMADLLCYQWLY